MKKLGIALLLTAVITLPILLLLNQISIVVFTAIGALWLLSALVLFLGPETITEITIWKASIKRDVQAAREIRDEVERVRTELRYLTKLIVEDSYIVASSSMLALGGGGAARKRIEQNLDKLSEFAEPIKEKEQAWWRDLEALFASHGTPENKNNNKPA